MGREWQQDFVCVAQFWVCIGGAHLEQRSGAHAWMFQVSMCTLKVQTLSLPAFLHLRPHFPLDSIFQLSYYFSISWLVFTNL